MERDEQGTYERLVAGRKELFEPEIARHHGRIFKLMGDGLLAEFSSVVDAVPYADFTTRGGWRGPHNINHHQHHPDVEKQGDLFYIAHFNAGLRIYDVSNRRLPREVGYFIPPEPVRRYGPIPEDKLVLQTEDVVVDRRGFIYISDKNQGIWVLRYIGERPQARRA